VCVCVYWRVNWWGGVCMWDCMWDCIVCVFIHCTDGLCVGGVMGVDV
jgi:hypothetical protein